MIQLLNSLFDSTDFWRRFTQERYSELQGSLLVKYRYKTAGRNILLTFFEHEGLVKGVSVVVDRRTVVEHLFFLTLEELTLILDRVPEIRSANPLCSGSESIKALSYSSQRPSRF